MKWLTPLKNFWTNSPKKQRIKLIMMLFILAAILLLMPSSSEKQASNPPSLNMINQQNLPTQELESLLSEITGNKVKVVVAYADSGKVDVIKEESVSSQTKSTGEAHHQKDEKPVLDANKNIQIQNLHNPRIKGVCIFCFSLYQKETEELLYRAAKASLGADLHTVEVIFKSNSPK